MYRVLFRLTLIGLFLLVNAPAIGGNKEKIEERVQELGTLNEQAVRQIEDLPSHGQVEIKADVKEQEGGPVIEIREKKVTPTEPKDEPIDLTGSKGVLPPVGQPNKQTGASQ